MILEEEEMGVGGSCQQTNIVKTLETLLKMNVAQREDKQRQSSCSFGMVLADRAWVALGEARNPVGDSL